MANEAHHATEAIHHTVEKVGHHAAEHAHHATEAGQHGAAHAEHAAHELPNWITILNNQFPDNPIVHFLHQWENVLFSMMAASIICFFAIKAAKKQSIVPDGLQNFVEAVVEALEGFVSGILGPKYGAKYTPYIGTVFLYILLMNWSGLVPLMKSPTAAWSTTLAVALTTMVYIQFSGMKEQGVKHYMLHIAGNPKNLMGWVMVAIMLPLNIILEFGAVPFSLSLRLFANISSEDRLLLNFAELTLGTPAFIGIFFQIFANCLALIFSIIQAFVFMLLSTVYIALVMPHDDHEHDEAPHSEAAHAH